MIRVRKKPRGRACPAPWWRAPGVLVLGVHGLSERYPAVVSSSWGALLSQQLLV